MRVVALRSLIGLISLCMVTDVLAALGQAPFLRAPMVSAQTKPRLLAPAAVLKTAYTVHDSQLESGTVVREFADASGRVFALTWRGPVLPDFSQWLGGHFEAFKQETDQQRLTGRRGAPINMAQTDLVVRSNGRMRNFFGYAYLPTLVPTAVDINEVLRDELQ